MKTRMKQLAIVLLALLFFAACNNAKNDKDVIKIGAILPLTGKLSTMGEFEKNSLQLALGKINNNEDRIKLIFEDGKGNPKDAVNAAKKLLEIDNVDIIITSTTGASLAVEPIVTEKKKNMIAFCMDPDIAKKSDYVVRYYIGINEEALGIMNYFNAGDFKNKRIGFLYGRVPVWDKVINQTFEPFFKSKNIQVKFNESYEINEADFNSIITKLKEANVTDLILLGYGFEYQNIFKSLSENNILGTFNIIGGWGFLYTPVDKSLLEGIYVSGPDYVFENQELAKDFSQDYFNKYGVSPNFDAAFAYEVLISLNNNFNKSDLLTPIKKQLTSKGKIKGVVGNYYFNESGEMIVETSLGIIKKGNIVSVK